MTRLARYRILALVFMLVVSNLALVSHVTAHFHPKWVECELCVSQAQNSAAIPVADQCPPLGQRLPVVVYLAPTDPLPSVSIHPNQPRAPPFQSR
jgi:hypothetical protein